jgi:transglutaminase-like putative cysteine protease
VRTGSWVGLLALGLTAPGPAAQGATILEKNVLHEIGADGAVTETTRLSVLLEGSVDREGWSRYAIYLDTNRTLEAVTARVRRPDGRFIDIGKKDQDVVQGGGSYTLHSSVRYHVLTLPPPEPGAMVHIDYRVRVEPYFPGGFLSLFRGDEAIAKLAVEVRGAPAGWRWHLTQPVPGMTLQVSEQEGGLTLVGEGLEAPDPPERAPGEAAEGPILLYSWGAAGTWDGVGRWYTDLLRQLGAEHPEARARARELVAGVSDPRERLEKLLAYASRNVRYVAVEVGVGGYRPSPPVETLTRGWGDCKDKSLLLVEMLREAGIPAHLALVRSTADEQIDPAFPSPYVFNHAIVAVSTKGLATLPTDPVAEGWLFVDPTFEKGNSRWLNPWVQDQQALVVLPEQSRLVRTPFLPAQDGRELTVELSPAGEVGSRGTAELVLSGRYGQSLQELIAAERPERVEEVVHAVFRRLLPGVALSGVAWGVDEGSLPRAILRAAVTLPTLRLDSALSSSLQLPGLSGLPATSLLDNRQLPLLVEPGRTVEHWTLHLPREDCQVENPTVDVHNGVGSYRQTAAGQGQRLTVERTLELVTRRVPPEAFADFRELALAEGRSKKRRLRLVCGEG